MSITLDQVTKHYGGAPVVNDVSLDIGDGEFFVLLGPSGSGKSTLLHLIAGVLRPADGTIRLDVDAHDVILLIGYLSRLDEDEADARGQHLLGVVLDGLRRRG